LRYKQDDRIVYASPVVDVAATVELADETVELCGEVLENTGWTIRLLSKSTLLGRIAGKIPAKWSRRIIYGVSTGTFDDEVAAAIEPDAPPPSKRLETLAELQRQGLRTFAMLCPILPQDPILFVKTASDRIDFRKCQHVWAEVLNRRGNSMERTARALEQAGLESWAERLHRVYGDGSTPQWEAYARSTFAALSAVVPSGKLRFMQYVTPRSVEWWRGHEKLGAMVLGAAANRNGEPTEGETRRKAKRSEAAKKAQVTIRANRAKRGSTDRLPRPKTSKQPVTQR
jgi:DNA repair photolyase